MSSQKGKRSIQDAPVHLTKMGRAASKKNEIEMEDIMKHFEALQGILRSTKKLLS